MTDRLEQHSLSVLFPSMPDVDFEALVDDIKKHGQLEPGLLFEGKVLDGWHRYLACERIGIEFSHRPYEGDDPASFVSSKNLHRRHMTASQRAACIVACAEWRPNGIRFSTADTMAPGAMVDRMAPGAGLTNEQMAELADASPRTIRHAKVAHQKGLGGEVRSGRMSAKRAAEAKAKKPAAAKEPKPAKEKTVPVSKYEALQAEHLKLQKSYETLESTFKEMAQKLETYESISKGKAAEDMQTLRQQLAQLEVERNKAEEKAAKLSKEVTRLTRELKKLPWQNFEKQFTKAHDGSKKHCVEAA